MTVRDGYYSQAVASEFGFTTYKLADGSGEVDITWVGDEGTPGPTWISDIKFVGKISEFVRESDLHRQNQGVWPLRVWDEGY